MASIKRDDAKQKWEETEFPLVCETCLGDNPYVRMTKETHGKKCRVCDVPFTVFAWQAGTRGRLKKVEVCRTCARSKNVCQVCIYDLQYGLPVQVRDRILAEEGGRDAVAAVPQSEANRSWASNQAERAIEQGTAVIGSVPTTTAAQAKLSSMARMEPRYERNLPKICSFYAKGECNRGGLCPFRHELPRDRNDPLSKQNTKDRFFGTNDPVAEKMMGRKKEREEKRRAELKARGSGGDERAASTLYVRFVDDNDGGGGGGGGGGSRVTESQIRDKFYAYGEISSVRMHASGGETKGAFVEFTSSKATEHAIASAHRTLLGAKKMVVNWARVPKRGAALAGATMGAGSSGGPVRPLAPPGAAAGGGGPSAPRAAATAGFGPVRLPGAVGGGTLGVPRPGGGLGVPRPGGGVIRRAGVGSVTGGVMGSSRGMAPKPYYPSADPGRLGSRTAAPESTEGL